MKVKISDITEKDFARIYERTKSRIKEYISKHPGKSSIDLMIALKLPVTFMADHTICMKCGYVEEKALYALAHRNVTFTCTCGNKIKVS